MGAKTHSPAYLVFQSSGYCFRFIVPEDLRPIVGKRELRYSLRTGFVSLAKERARRMAVAVNNLFSGIRKGGQMRELSEAQIKTLLAQYLKETLEQDETSRVMQNEPSDAE